MSARRHFLSPRTLLLVGHLQNRGVRAASCLRHASRRLSLQKRKAHRQECLCHRRGSRRSIRETQALFSCGRVSTLRPHNREKKSDCNPDRNLDESMKGDLPWGIRPRYEQHNRKRNAREAIRAAVRAHQRTKKSENQDAGAEEKHVWREMACHQGTNQCSKRGSDEPFPGNGEPSARLHAGRIFSV